MGDVGLDLIERMRDRLIDPPPSDALLSTLEHFSTAMWDELHARLSSIEGKAVNLLGWSAALLALLLLPAQPPSPMLDTLTGIGAIATLAASLAAAEAARPRDWRWPTVDVWFCESEFADPRRLRALHLTELLASYLDHASIAKRKGQALVVSQWALVAATMIVGLALLLGLR